MVTLLGYSLELVRRGETTLEEVGPVKDAVPVCRKAGSSVPIA